MKYVRIEDLSQSDIQALMKDLTPEQKGILAYKWDFWARKDQLPPPENPEKPWHGWLIMAGRGWGKTRTGAEFVRSQIQQKKAGRIGIVSETAADGRDVIVEGESGILAISPPWDKPVYEPSKRRVTWPNGATATLYDAREPDQMRGPQHDLVWFDEMAKYRYAQDIFDMAMFGLRLGDKPKWIATTTPRPIPIIKTLIVTKGVITTRGKTTDNLKNLASTFLDTIVNKYKGTRLGRQELDAEVLDDVPGALWARRILEEERCPPRKKPSAFPRIVVAVDPSITGGEQSNECGIITCAQGDDGHGYVLEDSSGQMGPDRWARRAVAVYRQFEADSIVAEANQGGEMVRMTIQSVDPNVPVTLVRATRGKYIRAEPIAAMYEQGRIHHMGTFPVLEDQMTTFTQDRAADRSDGYSPDRVDALVWGFTDIFPSLSELGERKSKHITAPWIARDPGMGMLG